MIELFKIIGLYHEKTSYLKKMNRNEIDLNQFFFQNENIIIEVVMCAFRIQLFPSNLKMEAC